MLWSVWSGIVRQVRRTKRALVAVWVPTALLLAVVTTADGLSDPTLGAGSGMGAPSADLAAQLTVLLWAAAAGVALFAAAGARRLGGDPDAVRFLRDIGLLALVYAFDGVVLGPARESAGPVLLPHGALEAIYGLLVVILVVRHRHCVRASDSLLLALACIFLAAGALVSPPKPGESLLGDGMLLFGAAHWAAYVARLAGQVLARELRIERVAPAGQPETSARVIPFRRRGAPGA